MARLKAQGLTPGVSDYIVPVPVYMPVAGGLWLELKRTKGGRISWEQDIFQRRMVALGYESRVGLGWEDARLAVLDYLRRTGEGVKEPANGIVEPPPWWPR